MHLIGPSRSSPSTDRKPKSTMTVCRSVTPVSRSSRKNRLLLNTLPVAVDPWTPRRALLFTRRGQELNIAHAT